MMHHLKRSGRLHTTVAALAALALSTAPLGAQKVNDAVNDFLPSYGGPHNGDLDVVSAQVFFDGSKFAFTATMNGAIGTTTGGFYVWGVNKGAGTQGFATIAPGVLFDAVVIMRPTTGITIGGVPVNDFFFASGNTITGVVPLSFLPSTGFAANNYTWNLWPRAPLLAGDPAVSDFAPNNSNAALTIGAIPPAVLATPEPGTVVMVGVGLAGLMATLRRRQRGI